MVDKFLMLCYNNIVNNLSNMIYEENRQKWLKEVYTPRMAELRKEAEEQQELEKDNKKDIKNLSN